MSAILEFVAIIVPELKPAEHYYRGLFDMDVITRETMLSDGAWYAVPPERGWADLEQTGIELRMLALRRDDFVLAMFKGQPVVGQIFTIGLSMTPEEIADLHSRLPQQSIVEYIEGQMLQFFDDYKFFWQVYASPYRFRSMGETTGRWLDLP